MRSMSIKGAISIMPIRVGMILDILYVTGSTRLYMILTMGLEGSGRIHERIALTKITQKYAVSSISRIYATPEKKFPNTNIVTSYGVTFLEERPFVFPSSYFAWQVSSFMT